MPSRRITRVEFVGPIKARPAATHLLPATPQARLDLLCRILRAGRFAEAQALAARIGKAKPKGSTELRAWFDGTCQPNPGGFGALVKRNGETIFSTSRYLGSGPTISNHVAEFAGLIAVFRYLLAEGIESATIYSDSRLVVGALEGEIRVRNGLHAEHYREALSLREQLPDVRLAWISRGQNHEADKLARAAILSLPCQVDLNFVA